MKHPNSLGKRLGAILLALSTALSLCSGTAFAVQAEEAGQPSVVSEQPGAVVSTGETTWKYLDDNTDPSGGDENPHSWTLAGYDDSQWAQGKGPFGAKKGAISTGAHGGYTAVTLLRQYQDGAGEPNTPAFFFRTTFDLANAAGVEVLSGSLLYDDGAIVYINGVEVAAFNTENVTGNLSYNNGKSSSDAAQGSFTLTGEELDKLELKNTGNVLAVELHQDGEDSSDIFLDF